MPAPRHPPRGGLGSPTPEGPGPGQGVSLLQLPLLKLSEEEILERDAKTLRRLSDKLYLRWQRAKEDLHEADQEELWQAHERAWQAASAKRRELRRLKKAGEG